MDRRLGPTVFSGYDGVEGSGEVLAIVRDGQPVDVVGEGETAEVVFDQTPFYGEGGGQAGDQGEVEWAGGNGRVIDVQKPGGDLYAHALEVTSGSLEIGQRVSLSVAPEARLTTRANHSATHLLHAALKHVLGDHVAQKGQMVDHERIRFDFSHNAPVTDAELAAMEAEVNAVIRQNLPATTELMAPDQAIEAGAVALFGEKYGDEVRVLTLGQSLADPKAAYSVELCGGTHVGRTGDIGLFKIVSEAGVAAGVRRVEAITGRNALRYVQTQETCVQGISALLKTTPDDVAERVVGIMDNVRALEKELARLKSKLASSQGDDLVGQAVEVKGAKVLAATLDGADVTALRETMDKLKDKLKSAAIVLSSVADGKVTLIAGVTADLTGKVKAGELVNLVAQQVGGKGGGRPDMAQAGGTQPENLPAALASVKAWVEGKL